MEKDVISKVGEDVAEFNADHPIFAPMQLALSQQFDRELEEVNEQLRQRQQEKKQLEKFLEDVGASLYNQQRMVAGEVKKLSSKDGQLEELRLQRKTCDDQLAEATENFDHFTGLQKQKEVVLEELRKEQNRLGDQILKMTRFNESVTSEALLMRRSASKTSEVISSLEREKEIQDREIAWLEEQVDRAKRDIERIQGQIKSGKEEKEQFVELLREAEVALQKEYSEQKKLTSQINSANQALLRRNLAVSESLRAVQTNLMVSRECEAETAHLRKQIAEERSRSDKLVRDWFGRSQVARGWLLAQIDSDSKVRDEIIGQLSEVGEGIKKANAECEVARRDLKREEQAEKSVLEAIFQVQENLNKLKDKSLNEIGAKNAASASYAELVKEYRRLTKFEKEREAELVRVVKAGEAARTARGSAESDLAELRARLDEKETRLKALEEECRVLSRDCLQLEKRMESKKLKLEKFRAKINEKKTAFVSSEWSSSLLGKVKGMEAEIASGLAECAKLETEWLTRQDQVLVEESAREAERQGLKKTKAVLVVLESKRQRKAAELMEKEFELKRRKNDVLKLKLDLDKFGALLLRFRDKIDLVTDLAVKVEESLSDRDLPHRRLEELNEILKSEIEALIANREKIELNRLDLEQKLEIEEELQQNAKTEIDSAKWNELQRTINHMRSELVQVNKRKDALSKSLVKRIENPHKSKSQNRYVSHHVAALSSCSTVASLDSLQKNEKSCLSDISEKRKKISLETDACLMQLALWEKRDARNGIDIAACAVRLDAAASLYCRVILLLKHEKTEENELITQKRKQLVQRQIDSWKTAVSGVSNPEWDPIKTELLKWLASNSNLIQ